MYFVVIVATTKQTT